jgi:hypothetical protein
MRAFVKKAAQCLADIGASCPYTLLGKKVVRSATGQRNQTPTVSRERENELMARMKTGRNIALIGVFCPFFWYSLFSGAPANEVYFNAMHSGVVVLIGLVLMLKVKLDFNKEEKRGK